MKKTYLAASIAALLAASASTQATQVFKDSKNTVSIGGYADMNLSANNNTNSDKSGELDFNDNTSRINFVFSRDLGSGWEGGATVEYGANLVGSRVVTGEGGRAVEANKHLNLRLGNVSLGKDKLGTFTFGKAWGVYYDIGGVTDVPHVWSPVYGIYGTEDGGLMGTGRADKVIQYRNQMGGLKIGLQYQPHTLKEDEEALTQATVVPITDTNGAVTDNTIKGATAPVFNGNDATYLEYGPTMGLSVRYQIGKIEAGVAYNASEIGYSTTAGATEASETLDDTILGISLKFGDYDTNGFFAGFVYAMGTNHSNLDDGVGIKDSVGKGLGGGSIQPKTTSMELVASFKTDMIRPYFGYYNHKIEKTDDLDIAWGNNLESFTAATLTVGADLFVGDGFLIYAEYAMDMGSESDPDQRFINDGNNPNNTINFEDAMADGYGGWALGLHYDF